MPDCVLIVLIIIGIIMLYKHRSNFVHNPKYPDKIVHYKAEKSEKLLDKPIYLFWHIGALPEKEKRLEQILSRQYALIKNSGFYDILTNIYVGIVGPTICPALTKIKKDPKVILIKPSETSDSLHEDYTSQYLWLFAKTHRNAYVLYLHSRGITREPGTMAGDASDDWTFMMEYYIIQLWKNNISLLQEFNTLGCNMVNEGGNLHYAGNFWWARTNYIATLQDPESYALMKARNDGKTYRYYCCENWILSDFNPNKNLSIYYMGTPIDCNKTGIVQYQDMYPPENYIGKYTFYTCQPIEGNNYKTLEFDLP